MATECGACKKPILDDNGTIKCGECKHTFHLSCTPIQTSENIKLLGVSVDNWTCPKCSTAEPPGSFVDEVVTRIALEDVVGEMKKNYTLSTETVKNELAELKKSVSTLSKQVGEFRNSVTNVEDEICHLQLENNRLQTKNGNLWRTVVRLGDELNDLQQLRGREMAVESREADNEVVSPKTIAVLTLRYITMAGLFYTVASRLFNTALEIMFGDPEEGKQNEQAQKEQTTQKVQAEQNVQTVQSA